MIRRVFRGLLFLGIVLAASSGALAPQPPAAPLARLMPAGPLLYLESPDFAQLLREWNDSTTRAFWLASDNYRVFSRSRLSLRLREVQQEFAAAASAPPQMDLMESVAGSESGLALYDIGKLEFLYVTRLAAPRAMENALWRGKQKFEPRKVADISYYVRSEPSRSRLVAFATTNDYLLIATREDLMTGALTALSGKTVRALADEAWYATAARAAGGRGDLRMVLNLERLVKSSHFRSYWIQRNVSTLRSYSAEIADVHRAPHEIREDRLLLRAPAATTTPERAQAGQAVLASLLRLVPRDAGLYRAWSTPSADQVFDLLRRKVLAPEVGPGVPSQVAPVVALSEGETGTEADLETRIDAPPFASTSNGLEREPVMKLFAGTQLTGVLQLQSVHPLPGKEFVGTQSAIVIEAANDWNPETARQALARAVEGVWTISGTGVNWVERGTGDSAYFELDGLSRIAMVTRGRLLIVGTDREPVIEVLDNMSSAPGEQRGVYAAGFRHTAEREDLARMTRLIETPLAQQFEASGGREPWFFSENLASLSRSLARVQSEAVLIRDQGAGLAETVTYHLGE